MWNELKKTAAAFAILISVCAPLAAQSEQQLEQDKKLVLEFWREVLDAHHVELASKYLAPGYIQHNPEVETGRDGFVNFSAVLCHSRFSPP
jgi:hypothetical protein